MVHALITNIKKEKLWALGQSFGKIVTSRDFPITFSCLVCKKQEKGTVSIQTEPAHGTLASQLKSLHGPVGWEKFGPGYDRHTVARDYWYCPACADLKGAEEILKI